MNTYQEQQQLVEMQLDVKADTGAKRNARTRTKGIQALRSRTTIESIRIARYTCSRRVDHTANTRAAASLPRDYI